MTNNSSWETCECGSDRFVAEQDVTETRRKDGKLERHLGEERVHCKACGAPAVAKESETVAEEDVKVLIGPPKHLASPEDFDDSDSQ